MKKNLISIAILLLLMVGFCQAQQIRSYGSGKLSCSLIKNIVQDAHGFVWIGTENGLNKFDGWTFTNYFHDERDSTSLVNNLIEALLCDRQGDLWVGSGKGLQLYSPYEDAFKNVTFVDGNKPSVLHLQELNTGKIWAVTAGYGVYSIDKEKMEATSLVHVNDLCSSTFMHNIHQDSCHRIWIALPNGKIVRITSDLKDAELISSSSDALGKVYTILEDLKGRTWVAAVAGIYLWNEDEHRLIRMEQPDNTFIGVRGMICTKRGELYVNTVNNGLYSVDVEKLALKTFNGQLELGKDRIYALMEDKDENLWIGGFKKGVVMLSNESSQFKFKPFSTFSPSLGNTLSFVYEDKKHRIWTSITNGRLIRIDEDMQNYLSYEVGDDILSMLHDSEGTIWLGSYSGLSQFDERTGTIHRLPLLQGKAIHNIVEGRNRMLYISVLGEGFAEYDKRTGALKQICDTTKLRTTMRLANNWANKVMCDSEGLVWLGHCMGVNCYDPVKQEFVKLECEKDLYPYLCFALLEDKNGHIWIGTNNGLFEYDKKTLKLNHYGIEEGMPSNMVCGLGQGKNGDIWCSTFNGLCRLHDPERKIVNYFFGNGLVDKEYLKSVYFQRECGNIYWGGLQGITGFMPDSIGRQSPLNAPQLTHVYLNNEEVSADTRLGGETIADNVWMDARQINLTYKNDIFSFEFSTMEFRDRENVRFEYRLVELGGVWRSTSSGENRITYNYLPSGHYTFEVCVCENERKSPVRSFSIYIAPPWYDTLWARIGYVLICAGLLFWGFYAWYMRQRRRRQDELNEEKLKFFINIAHELRSPITLIVSPLAALIKTEQEESRKKALLTMQRNANRILNLINQLLDIRKIDKGQMKIECRETDLVGFIEELFQMFDYQATKRNIQFAFVHTAEKLPVWIDRNNFDKVLMNLIVNAFKYTSDGGEIQLTLTVNEDKSVRGPLSRYAEITVVDSGMGLDEKKLERIFERFYQASSNSHGFGIGLNLTKMLVELHHGSISATNRTDKQGSCFAVRIPLGKEHLSPEELAENIVASNGEPVRLALNEEAYWEEEENKVQTSKSKTQWRILVVDDDEEIREYLKQELGIYYKVVTACNGVEAYQIALKQRIDLIISDVVMPEMDGFELLKKTRGNANISHIPFVLLTSQTESDSRLKGWNVGADAFLTKPFQIEELFLICENLITGRVRLKGRFGMDQEVEEKMKPIEVKANNEFFMERLMKAINENLEDPKFSVEDLAEAVGVSRVQLHRKLKVLTGNTTTEFLRNIRLKQAAKLLKEKKVNISQIAYLVGFTNPTLFSIAFKKFYGCAPSEYADREYQE